jgi:hypothetical protein
MVASVLRFIRLAVLVDGDNFSSRMADELIAAVAELGSADVLRVYGSHTALTGWRGASSRHAMTMHEVLPGKNAADMRLAIDAMDLLHRGRMEAYCLVTSDGDFAELARRLREDGVVVHGIGGGNPSARFRNSCHTFKQLTEPVSVSAPIVAVPLESSAQEAKHARAALLLWKACEKLGRAKWHDINTVLKEVRKSEPKFTAGTYGYSKPKTLIGKLEGFELQKFGNSLKVRLQQDAGASTTRTKAA